MMSSSPSRNLERTYSESFEPGKTDMDLLNNKNIDWMSSPFVSIFYIVVVLLVLSVLHISGYFSAEDCWMATNVLHGVVSIVIKT